MPIDFNRIPPRVSVPALPEPSKPFWAILLLVIMGVGAALTIAVWAPDFPTDTPWFWICLAVFPVLVWGFLLCAWLGYGHARCIQALATNHVVEQIEQSCHDAASRPLAILGNAWCFSSRDAENLLAGVLDGSVQVKTRPSRAMADSEVNARWIEIPDEPLCPGNELDEHARHKDVCEWLLQRLIGDLTEQLNALPARTPLYVELHLRSKLEHAVVQTRLQDLLDKKAPALSVTIVEEQHGIQLFSTDAWFDDSGLGVAHLVVAIELRNAISQVLSDGVAEMGAALLVGHPSLAQATPSPVLHLHRPARGSLDAIASTVGLAIRWGHTTIERVSTAWAHGVSSEQSSATRKLASFPEQTKWIALETTVGDCSDSGVWLAVALAAANAKSTGDPQLVLSHHDGELVALVCRKPDMSER
jgi:hypothetical protein